ncbi:MAG TPA: hypothetical protein VMD57_05355 [Candidatus Baltobacteraceae bacterium]|nr:hypothetical protein [Candidatus Baltobacteraceae bacterium]
MKKLLAALLSLTFAASIHAAIPPAENLLPSDTLLFFTVPDCATLRATAHQSPQWLFWSDPAMKPFHDKLIAKWSEAFVAPLEHDLGVKLDDFADLPQGQFTFAVTQNGWNGIDPDKTPGTVLLLDAGDKSDLLKTNLVALQKKWAEDGKPIHTETIHGISFSVVPLSSNDIPESLSGFLPRREPVQELGVETKPAPNGELLVGQFKSLLIAGNSAAAIEPVVTHLTGGGMPSLNDNAVFAADKISQFHNAPLYYAWFNAKTIFTTLARIPAAPPNTDAPSPVPPIPWDNILGASGLTGLKSISLAYRENHDGAELDLFVAVPESGRQGIFKMIATAPENAAPPMFVPADVVKFWRWRVDGQDAWDTLQKMLADISPGALNGLNATINMANASAQQKDPGFDVRKDLIANLGDDWISYQKSPTGTTPEDLARTPSLFLFAALNAEQAVLAIKNVASLTSGGQKAPEPRDFLGKKIYTIPLPSPRMPGADATAAPARALYCAASGGYVAVTTDVSMLEEYLRNGEKPVKPLGGTPGLIDAAAHIGGAGNGLFGYENQRETMRTVFTLFKNMSGNNAGNFTPLAAFPQSLRDWFDFSLLPDYDAVSKYFSFSVYNGSTTVDGLSFKFFTPRPPQLN